MGVVCVCQYCLKDYYYYRDETFGRPYCPYKRMGGVLYQSYHRGGVCMCAHIAATAPILQCTWEGT